MGLQPDTGGLVFLRQGTYYITGWLRLGDQEDLFF